MADSKRQERALGAHFKNSRAFVAWFLSQTKFAAHSDADPVLIRDDWPWYQASDGRQSETDVLAVFRSNSTGERFALHIENKTANDRFRPGQAVGYNVRAQDWLKTPKWGDYQDFECVLIAPLAFAAKHREDAGQFDRFIAHESLAEYIPDFAADKEP